MIEIRFFAALRERVGSDRLAVSPPDSVDTVAKLVAWLETDPALAEALAATPRRMVAVNEVLGECSESVFISDGGEFGQWTQAVVESTHRVINGPSGSIGSGVPFALAARLACPEATVIATVGDGTFGFHAMELETAIRYDLPLVIVVGNDACWNAEYQIQLDDYGEDRLVGCELADTRYDELCRSMGGWGGRGGSQSKQSHLSPSYGGGNPELNFLA